MADSELMLRLPSELVEHTEQIFREGLNQRYEQHLLVEPSVPSATSDIQSIDLPDVDLPDPNLKSWLLCVPYDIRYQVYLQCLPSERTITTHGISHRSERRTIRSLLLVCSEISAEFSLLLYSSCAFTASIDHMGIRFLGRRIAHLTYDNGSISPLDITFGRVQSFGFHRVQHLILRIKDMFGVVDDPWVDLNRFSSLAALVRLLCSPQLPPELRGLATLRIEFVPPKAPYSWIKFRVRQSRFHGMLAMDFVTRPLRALKGVKKMEIVSSWCRYITQNECLDVYSQGPQLKAWMKDFGEDITRDDGRDAVHLAIGTGNMTIDPFPGISIEQLRQAMENFKIQQKWNSWIGYGAAAQDDPFTLSNADLVHMLEEDDSHDFSMGRGMAGSTEVNAHSENNPFSQ